jgi:hypothetical protein
VIDRILSCFDAVDPQMRRKVALILLIASAVGWPVSALTFARHEPPFILGLSWFAITTTCLDVLCTTDVRVQDEESE